MGSAWLLTLFALYAAAGTGTTYVPTDALKFADECRAVGGEPSTQFIESFPQLTCAYDRGGRSGLIDPFGSERGKDGAKDKQGNYVYVDLKHGSAEAWVKKLGDVNGDAGERAEKCRKKGHWPGVQVVALNAGTAAVLACATPPKRLASKKKEAPIPEYTLPDDGESITATRLGETRVCESEGSDPLGEFLKQGTLRAVSCILGQAEGFYEATLKPVVTLADETGALEEAKNWYHALFEGQKLLSREEVARLEHEKRQALVEGVRKLPERTTGALLQYAKWSRENERAGRNDLIELYAAAYRLAEERLAGKTPDEIHRMACTILGYLSGEVVLAVLTGGSSLELKASYRLIEAVGEAPGTFRLLRIGVDGGEEFLGKVSLGGMLRPSDEVLAVMRGADEVLTGKVLSSAQKNAVVEAHFVGLGQTGKNPLLEAGIGNYTWAQLRDKVRILKNAGFETTEIRKLMEKGVVGKSLEGSVNPSTWNRYLNPDFVHPTRNAAFRKAVEDLVGKSGTPVHVKKAPLLQDGALVLNPKTGLPVTAREYFFKRVRDGRTEWIVLQEHSVGHRFSDGDFVPSHFNVRKGSFDPKRCCGKDAQYVTSSHSHVEGSFDHYFFDPEAPLQKLADEVIPLQKSR